MLTKENTKVIYPLSPMQEGMFFHYLADEGSNAYFEQLSYTIKGHINLDLVDKAINEIIDRYDLLRTVFTDKTKNKLYQIVLKKRCLKIIFRDIANTHNKEEIINSIKKEDIEKGFDLTKDILVRITVLKTGADEYEFIWSHHHIIMDGWCIGIIINEFQYIYNCYLNGYDPKLAEVKQYGDFISWLEKKDKGQSRLYWSKYLQNYEGLATFPKKEIKSDSQSNFSLASESLIIEKSEILLLKDICKDLGVTQSTLFQTTWGILLSKYNNSNDIVFGSVVSGRPSDIEGIEAMVGLFINTLPVRINYEESLTVGEIIKKVQVNMIEREDHQYLSLADIQSLSELKRELFDHIFVFENYPLADKIEGTTTNNEDRISFRVTNVNVFEQTNFDLSIIANPSETIKIRFDYNLKRFDKEFIKKLILRFKLVLDQIIVGINDNISNIKLLTEEEKYQILYEFNNTKVNFSEHRTLIDLFEKQVELLPNSTAIISNGILYSYEWLNTISNKLAYYLRDLGVKSQSSVVVIMDRRIELIVALIGILKSGGNYVPIEPFIPNNRKKVILNSVAAEHIITSKEYYEDIYSLQKEISSLKNVISIEPDNDSLTVNKISIDENHKTNLNSFSTNNLERYNSSDELAYIIFTSGSSGEPKGVAVQHKPVINLIEWVNKTYSINETDKLLFVTSISFDLSVYDIFGILASGGTIRIANREELEDPENLSNILIEEEITFWDSAPAQLQQIIPLLQNKKGRANSKAKLRLCFLSGDWIPLTMPPIMKSIFKDLRFIALGGATEATVWSNYFEVDEIDTNWKSVPYGKPIQNAKYLILDKDKNICPIGFAGDLYIGGQCLAKEYINDKNLTEQKFIPNPFEKNEILYNTGDMAKWFADGNIEFLGRKDSQVKIRGYRIELGEIESCFLKINDIDQVLAHVISKDKYDKFICLYYVSKETIPTEKLNNILSSHLPSYMVPKYFVHMDSLPMTKNGKVDRKALPNPQIRSEDNYAAPVTKEEIILTKILSVVLGVENIGLNDNFFALGGDSIKTIQVSSRMRKEGFSLAVKDILGGRKIKDISSKIKEISSITDQSTVIGKFPLSPIQKWFFDRDIRNKHHFNQSVLLSFENGLSKEEIETIFSYIQNHHDALRIVFRENEGDVWQENREDNTPISLEIVDLSNEAEYERHLLGHCNKIQSGIDLEKGPLMRLGLFHTKNGSLLLIVIHHLVIDGISWRILLEDIENLYNQIRNNKVLALPLKSDSFYKWSNKLLEYSTNSDFQLVKSYWDQVSKKENNPIKRDNIHGENKISQKDVIAFQLNKYQTDKLLKDVNNSFNTQVNDILLTALLLSINKLQGHTEIKIELEGHGREEIISGININRTIGWFTSIYPVVLQKNGKNLSDLIKYVKETLRKIPDNGIGYLVYKYLVNKEKPLKKNESQICFNYLGQFDTDISGRSFKVAKEERGYEISKDENRNYDWDISGMVSDAKLSMNLMYSKDQYNKETINSFMNYFKETLVEIIEYCCNRGKKELTPSDLTYTNLTINELDILQSNYELEDVYPLSPMQEGMLFHSLLDSNSENYFEQMTYHLQGDLNIPLLKRSIRNIFSRYDILRTNFLDQGYDRPLQIVLKEKEVDFIYKDIREEIKGKELGDVIKYYQKKDKLKKFDLSNDALVRITILQNGESEFVFIWSYHHILMDGWCMGIIINEFNAIYTGYKKGKEIILPAAQSYSKYINWIENRDKEKSKLYWSSYLNDYNTIATFPKKKIKDDQSNIFVLTSEHLVIDCNQVSQLNNICKNLGVTLNTILQVVWGILLSKYNNSKDVVYGSVVSGRPAELEGIETMIGLFINTLPVRINYTEKMSVEEMLNEVQEKAIEREFHQYLPLSDIQSLSELKRELFDHIFVFENYPIADKIEGITDNDEGANLKVTNVEIFEQTNYDLSIILVPGETIKVRFDYNLEIFEKQNINKLVSRFKLVIDQIIENVNINILEIDILSDEEKHQILYDFNDTNANCPKDKTIIDLFEDQVTKEPEKIALLFNGKQLTYSELNAKSNQLGRALINLGIQPDDIVAIMAERSISMMVGILGILKSGGAYLPINPFLPEKRRNYILDNSEASVILTQENFFHSVNERINKVNIDNQKLFIGEVENLHRNKPNDLAYVIYTSGSTGEPKGVMIEHYPLLNRLLWMQKKYPIGKRDTLIQKTPYMFDVSVWEIFWWSITGSKLCILEPEGEKDPGSIIKAIEENKVTVIHFVPSMFNVFLDYINDAPENIGRIISLQQIFTSGEALMPVHVEKFNKTIRKQNKTRLANLYGPTEATVDVSYYDCPMADKIERVPIGKPIDNTQLYILNNAEQLQAVGIFGDLYIGGISLARGYLNQRQLTEEKFIKNIFGQGRIYKTGDIARWLPDGNIEYLGRCDNQVKIRGNRIELAEIENKISAYNKIKDSVVVVKEKGEEKYLSAYYVSDEELELSEIKSYLLGELPEYAVPSYFTRLQSIPLTSNGKVDRKTLPEPDIKMDNNYVAPVTKEEKILIKILSDILGVKNIGVNDNPFSLGADSIKTIQISSRLRREGYILTVKDILSARIIKDISLKIKEVTSIADQSAIIGKFPLSPIQKWFFNRDIKNKHHFNQSVLLSFENGLSKDEVETIFRHIQNHHDALRFVFTRNGNEIIQVSRDIDIPISLEVVDLKNEVEYELSLINYCNIIQSGIDLEKGPLMKLGLFHVADGSRLLIVIHHLIVDGVSWRILFEDIEALYQQIRNNKPFALPLKTSSFSSWAGHLLEYSKSNSFKKAQVFWNNFLNKNNTPIIRDNHNGDNKLTDSQFESINLNKEDTSKLLTKVQIPFGTQINDILLTALLLSIKKQYGKDSIIIDLEGHGREEVLKNVDVSRTIGWFTSIYPVLLEIKEDSLAKIIKQVKETLRQVPNKGIDFMIQNYLLLDEAKENTKNEYCSQICFNYLGQFDSDTKENSFKIADEAKGDDVSPYETSNYDWDISGIVVKGELKVNLRYSNKQYKKETINSLMNFYKESLVEVINYCSNYGKTELTPHDLSYKSLTIAQLDKLQQDYKVEDIYPLSPMQEGMLFHSLLDSEADQYFEQTTYQLKGKINVNAVEQSMNDLISRYGILRTIFLPDIYERPLQLVLKDRKSDFLFFDVRNECLNGNKEKVLKNYQLEDKIKKFNLIEDCLMRLTVLQTDNDEYEFIWSHPHILMDGWCLGIIINEFNSLYIKNNYGREITLPPVRPYSNYIEWIENINKKESEKYWKTYLNSYERLSSLPKKEDSLLEKLPYKYQTKPLLLNSEKVNLFSTISNEYGVTFNTIIQCAWAILLANYNNANDVVFGSVVSGRPSEIEGIETMIGLFINAIPVRIKINKEDSIGDLLKMVQNKALECEPFHYSPLSELQTYCELGRGLLDHIMVVENYPLIDRLENNNHETNKEEGLSVTNFQFAGRSNYDLVLLVTFGSTIEIKLDYNANVYEEEIIKTALLHLNSIIDQITENNKLTINEISLSHNLILADSNISDNEESDFIFYS